MKVFRTQQDHQHICRIEKKDKMFVEPLSDLSQYKARQIAGYNFEFQTNSRNRIATLIILQNLFSVLRERHEFKSKSDTR